MSKVIVVVGGQWGDEGKGAIVDLLAENADIVARYAGGNNAGHTVVVGKEKFKFHLLPSGIIHKKALNVLGNGMVIDPSVLASEIESLEQRGFSISARNLAISDRAHVITQQHIDKDREEGGKIGTTSRGIGPCYTDKIARKGVRMGDFILGDHPMGRKLKGFVADTSSIIHEALAKKKNFLIEGAQGTMLDVDHGTYPFVTSSNPTAGGACTGLGIGPTSISSVMGVFKAYTTRVGGGPFPTEQGTQGEIDREERSDEVTGEDNEKANDGNPYFTGKVMRRQGREYGTTTGRPRRCGWFDAVAARYAIRVNGLDAIVLTKIDVLSNLKKIKVCVGYTIDGKRVNEFPSRIIDIEEAEPAYEIVEGWDEDIFHAASFKELPLAAQKYIRFLEKLMGIPVAIVSVGPAREQKIVLERKFLF